MERRLSEAGRGGFLLPTLLGALAAAAAIAGRWLCIGASVETGYAAKVTCSLVRNSVQDPEQVLPG